MLERSRSLTEGFKSMLIFLLFLSALFLSAKVFLPYSASGEDTGVDLLPLTAVQTQSGAGLSRPVRMAVVNGDGRFAVQYDDAAVDALFDSLGDLLGEALSSAGAASVVDRETWERALLDQGVYYDFPGIVSLPLLSAWLGEGDTGLSARAACLLLAVPEGSARARLYYIDAGDGCYYACDTQLEFRQRLDAYSPNGAFFAFQQPERYGGLDADTLILSEVPSPSVYEAGAGLAVQEEETLWELLGALSFTPQPNAVYPAADGWTVREGEDSLRLTHTGNIYYHAGEGTDHYLISHEATESELMEFTGELVRQAISPYSGEARVYLAEMEQVESAWVLTYRYVLSGADVQLGQNGWCAQFVIEDGRIREYTLKLRRYEETETSAMLLPEYQAMYAMYAMGAEGRQLLLRYYDGGTGTVSPSWIAR